jgi:hypothetical protein
MKNQLLTVFLFLSWISTYGQINLADSTVQVITYWDKGEKQYYSISAEKIKGNL